jgi:hypothetical protein
MPNFIEIFDFGLSECTVSFKTNEDAFYAIGEINYGDYEGHELTAVHFLEPKELEKLQVFNLTVDKLDPLWRANELASFFSRYGDILLLVRHEPRHEPRREPRRGRSDKDDTSDLIGSCSVQYNSMNEAIRARTRLAIEHPKLIISAPKSKSSLGFYCAVYNFAMDITEARVRMVFPRTWDVSIQIDHVRERERRPTVWLGFFRDCREDFEEAMTVGEQNFSDGLRLFTIQTQSNTNAQSGLREAELRRKAISYQNRNTISVNHIPMHLNVTCESIVQACKIFGDINSCSFTALPPFHHAIVAFVDVDAYQRALREGVSLSFGTTNTNTILQRFEAQPYASETFVPSNLQLQRAPNASSRPRPSGKF